MSLHHKLEDIELHCMAPFRGNAKKTTNASVEKTKACPERVHPNCFWEKESCG